MEDKINWGKEITDIFSEVKIGLSDRFSISIPNIIQFEVEIDIASNDWVNNKGDTSKSGMSSGVILSGQIGPDNCPLASGALNYTKKSPQIGNAFTLLDVDYEFSTEVKVNNDFEFTPPIPFVNMTLNLSEGYDLLNKIYNRINTYIKKKVEEVKN